MNFNNDKELYRVIGKNIKLYRKFSKLTQVQLAETDFFKEENNNVKNS